MAYVQKSPKNDRQFGPLGPDALAKFADVDAKAATLSGYTAPVFVNDRNNGHLGPAVIARLNALTAAAGNGAAHYTAQTWANDRNVGHLGPDTLAFLNQLETQVASLRP